MLPGLVVAVVLAFLAAPGSFEHKAHAALHGLCAQRPSHSFEMGGWTLPFDARMTGIYGGFLATSVYLAARGRYRASRLPPVPVMAVLGGAVVALGVDGTNALLVDLRLWHPYEPRNGLRLATGLGTGVALAVIVCFLLATTLWRTGRWEERVIGGARELPILAFFQAPLAMAVWSGAGWLFMPVATLLLTAAVLVLGALMLVTVVLFRHEDRAYTSVRELPGVVTVALGLGVVLMAGLAAGRFWLERVSGVPPLT